MLNYETLLSSYDDKLTLMQWLKKVEKALAGASASSFEVIKTGNATIRFRINFEDGTYLESGDIVLQQGESVSSGEIRNGHLYLTLTNGQELDCGELFNGEVPSLQVRSLEVTGGLLVGDDANVAIGGDLVVHGLTEVQNLLAYGHVETETLTAAGDKINAEKPVVEVMNGYSFEAWPALAANGFTLTYVGIVKNGNKLTLAIAGVYDGSVTSVNRVYLGTFTLPTAVHNKLYPAYSNILDVKELAFFMDDTHLSTKLCSAYKQGTKELGIYIEGMATPLTAHNYFFRYEVTFLLSENLIS